MRRAARALVMLACMWLSGGVAAAAHVEDEGPRLRLVVSNLGRVPEETLRRALEGVEETMRAVGVRVIDEGPEAGAACALRVIIQPRLLSMRLRASEFVMGVTPGAGEPARDRAFIFYDQVRRVSQEAARDEADVLQLAIVHELGHLLLPYPAHTAAGVMQERWDHAAVRSVASGRARFSERQGGFIREALAEGRDARCATSTIPRASALP